MAFNSVCHSLLCNNSTIKYHLTELLQSFKFMSEKLVSVNYINFEKGGKCKPEKLNFFNICTINHICNP